jgi:hypothetical protein
MIVRPNADSMPANSKSPDATNGHAMDCDKNFTRPTPMSSSNVHGGGSNRGFGFAQDPTGENDYPRPDPILEGLPGFTGDGLGTPWKGTSA